MSIRSMSAALLGVALLSLPASGQESWPTKKWPTAMPKDVGLDHASLAQVDADIVQGDYTYVDSVTIIRHGKIAFDRTYPRNYDLIYGELAKKSGPLNFHDRTGPYNYFSTWWHPFYRRGLLHTLQSITKPILSILFGIAIERGDFREADLDTRVIKYFDPKKFLKSDARTKDMTVKHLLLMQSGIKWNWSPNPIAEAAEDTDTAFESSHDWVKFAIEREMADAPGAKFNYCSGNVQILAHIFREATGKDIEEFAAQHLFTPLGIENYYWKRTPSGMVDASGGLYLTPHDLAKVGYLYLHKGRWEGKQIVAAKWVKDSVTGHVETPEIYKGSKWGYLWGVLPYGDKGQFVSFGGGGFGGQGLVVLPDHEAVIVYTGWSILDKQPKLSPPTAIERFQRVVIDGKDGGKK